MIIRKLAFAFCALSLMAAPATSAPNTDGGAETVTIPFDPPLDGSIKYRWQRTDDRDGKTTMSWAVNQYSFEETADDIRLSVKAVSSGSNEADPDKLRIRARLEELMDLPYVLRLNADAEIVEMESGDEYWTKIFQALREALVKDKPTADEAKAIEGVISVFQQMPPDVELAKMTESVQPLVEFGNVELTVGDPIVTEIETASPFGGLLKQNVAITLHKVVDHVAFVTIRSSVPREEFAKIVGAFFDQVGEGQRQGQSRGYEEAPRDGRRTEIRDGGGLPGLRIRRDAPILSGTANARCRSGQGQGSTGPDDLARPCRLSPPTFGRQSVTGCWPAPSRRRRRGPRRQLRWLRPVLPCCPRPFRSPGVLGRLRDCGACRERRS